MKEINIHVKGDSLETEKFDVNEDINWLSNDEPASEKILNRPLKQLHTIINNIINQVELNTVNATAIFDETQDIDLSAIIATSVQNSADVERIKLMIGDNDITNIKSLVDANSESIEILKSKNIGSIDFTALTDKLDEVNQTYSALTDISSNVSREDFEAAKLKANKNTSSLALLSSNLGSTDLSALVSMAESASTKLAALETNIGDFDIAAIASKLATVSSGISSDASASGLLQVDLDVELPKVTKNESDLTTANTALENVSGGITTTPVLSASSTTINENESLEVTITNYDADYSYIVNTTAGTYALENDVIIWNMVNIDSNVTATMSVSAINLKSIVSEIATVSVDATYYPVDKPEVKFKENYYVDAINTIVIDNYDPATVYTATTDNGSITVTGNIVEWKLDTLSSASTVSISAVKNGVEVVTTKTVPAIDLDYSVDQSAVFDASTMSSFTGSLDSGGTLTTVTQNLVDSSKVSTSSKIFLQNLIDIQPGDILNADGRQFTVRDVVDEPSNFYVTPTKTLFAAPAIVTSVNGRAISTLTQEVGQGDWISAALSLSQEKINLLDPDNASTTELLYINNKICDIKSGDTLVDNNGNIFTADNVSLNGPFESDGTKGYSVIAVISVNTPFASVPTEIYHLSTLKLNGTTLEVVDVTVDTDITQSFYAPELSTKELVFDVSVNSGSVVTLINGNLYTK